MSRASRVSRVLESEVARFTRALLSAARLDHASRRTVERVRDERLHAVLEAARRTPLYRERLYEERLYEERLYEERPQRERLAGGGEKRLADIPPLTKPELTARLDESFSGGALSRAELQAFVRDPSRAGALLRERYLVAMTSGTTGEVGIFVNDLESWARTRGITFARIFRDELNAAGLVRLLAYRRYRMAFVVAAGGHYMTYLLASRVPPLGKLVTDARVCSVEMPVPALVAELNALRPHLLHSYPTVLELLCLEKRAGRLKIDPDIITAGSEPITPSCREAVADAFPRARLVEAYAATECVPLATSCRYGHLHVNEDACVLEPVDAELKPVPTGVLGEQVLVTNLLNTTQPIVRYALTDQVRLLDEPCPCGSPFVRLEVQGRTDDTFFLAAKDGSFQAHPPIPLELVFLRIPGLLQYQLVHERQNELRVRFVAEPGGKGTEVAAALDAQLSRYLANHDLLGAVTFTLEEVDAIARASDSKKLRQIWSQVPRPEGAATSAQAVRERRKAPRVKEPA